MISPNELKITEYPYCVKSHFHLLLIDIVTRFLYTVYKPRGFLSSKNNKGITILKYKFVFVDYFLKRYSFGKFFLKN